MSIELGKEKLVPLAEAARLIPGRPSIVSIWRWRKVGIRGHRLECVQIGGRIFTTKNAVEAFIKATTESNPTAPVVITTKRRRRLAEADRILAGAGI